MTKTLTETFFAESALDVADLTDGMYVEIYQAILSGIAIEIKDKNSNRIGFIEARKSKSGCSGAYVVVDAQAKHGFGPLLYDIMLEVVGTAGLISDRKSVSKEAGLVWKYYFENRNDVDKIKLDDSCDQDASKAQGAISSLDKNEIVRPWLNYVYYKTNKTKLKQLKKQDKLKNLLEGFVPQGNADKRSLHGAPTYFYPFGRSIKGKKDDGALKKARKWNKDGGLLDVEKIENKNKNKRRWYQKESYEYKSPYKMTKKEFLNYEEPKPDKGYRLLYHETSNENLKNIVKSGLKLDKSRADGTGDLKNTIWASTKPEGWYGRHPLVVFQVPKDEKEPTIEYAGSTVMIHRDISPKDIVSVDPVLNTEVGKERLSFFRNNSYADAYWDEHFGIKNKESLKEFSALSTAAIEASNIPPEKWDSHDSPRVNKKSTEKNEDFISKLDITTVKDSAGRTVGVSKKDPQYKRQISMVKSSQEVLAHKEPSYLPGSGEHRISKLGYAKIADRNEDLYTDIYLSPYDPNWRRSKEMVQKIIKHYIKNHGNPGAMPSKDYTMFVSIKESNNEKDIKKHLRSRGIDLDKTEIIVDIATNTATFLLYNMVGKIVGYQQYNPSGSKKTGDKNLAKYFTYTAEEGERNNKAIAVWGVQSIDDRPYLFVTEGIFDAVKLHNEGLPAIAVLTNSPKKLKSWFKILQKKIIAIADNDKAGRELKKVADVSYSTPEPYKDLGEMEQLEAHKWIWQEIKELKSKSMKEYYPHAPGIEGEFNSLNQVYYHGTNQEFAQGDYIQPPIETGNIAEKGRKKNLDKVFFTLDKGSAKIYADRAKHSAGTGGTNIYMVQPIGEIEWVNKTKGTTVLMAPTARVIKKIS